MKASRAYITSLGTTGLLLCFALLLLVVVSALTAFRGWPGQAGGDDSAAVRIDSGRAATAAKRVRQETALPAANAARPAARAPDPAQRARKAGGRDIGGVGGVSQQRAAAPAPAPAASTQSAAPAAPQQQAVKTPEAPRVDELSQGLGDTTRQVTEGAAGTLDSVGAAPLGDVVRQTGDTTARALPKVP